jgi:hypothetical protein
MKNILIIIITAILTLSISNYHYTKVIDQITTHSTEMVNSYELKIALLENKADSVQYQQIRYDIKEMDKQ